MPGLCLRRCVVTWAVVTWDRGAPSKQLCTQHPCCGDSVPGAAVTKQVCGGVLEQLLGDAVLATVY